jgi:hypothetical protein
MEELWVSDCIIIIFFFFFFFFFFFVHICEVSEGRSAMFCQPAFLDTFLMRSMSAGSRVQCS